MSLARCTAVVAAFLGAAVCEAGATPDGFPAEFVNTYCSHCHGGSAPAAGFSVGPDSRALASVGSAERWERAAEYVTHGVMPPHGAAQPSRELAERFAADIRLLLHGQEGASRPPSGLVRRLNQIEYLNTLRDLFGIREIRLPVTFPADGPHQRFDTMAEATYLTDAHLDAYHDVSIEVANRLVVLPGLPEVERVSFRANVGPDVNRVQFWQRPGDENGLYFTGINIAGWTGGIWDKGFSAPASGLYRVRLKVSAQGPAGVDGRPLRLGFYALNQDDYFLPKRARRVELPRVGSLDVTHLDPQEVEIDLPLEEGENFHIFCENRLQKEYPDALLRPRGNTADLRRLLAEYLREALASPEPTVRFESMHIEGPVAPLPRQRRFERQGYPDDRSYAAAVLLPIAEKAFRRPLAEEERAELLGQALDHMAASPAPEYGIHYGIRRILLAPQFLFREMGGASVDDFMLASRLSYFLWSTMPDAELQRLAASGDLSAPAVLEGQVRRMVRDPRAQQFVKHFAGQWLGNRKAATIMVCDVRHQWSELIRYGMVRSAELFLDEILQENLTIRTFIDSDFTYANEPMRIAWGIPGNEVEITRLEADQRQSLLWPEPERLDLANLGDEVPEHVATRGGVLGLSSVFAATGDGVESSPILRGVWVLENLLGTPPPPPPSDVPALVADTSEARTVRELLSAHQQVESCAVCHSAIDPIGLALENYDAVGGWRTEYFREDGSEAPAHPVVASSEMQDGTVLEGPEDLKAYLMARPAMFTRALAGLLLEYAIGRELAPGDRRSVEAIAATEPAGGYGLQDLLLRIANTEAFRGRDRQHAQATGTNTRPVLD